MIGMPACSLQWGRGLSTAEMRRQKYLHGKRYFASMGPRSFDRGDKVARFFAAQNWPSFNGAAVFRPRRWLELVTVAYSLTSFNGAAVFRPRRSRTLNAHHFAVGALQWGRGLSTAEILVLPVK